MPNIRLIVLLWVCYSCTMAFEVQAVSNVDVASVDSMFISGEELREFIVQMPQGLRSRKEGDVARRDYLRSLLARYLMELEVRERGLDTLQTVREAVVPGWHERLIEAYRQENLRGPVEVSEEEIGRYYEENHLGPRRQLAGIILPEKDRAEEVLERLVAGEAFEDLAQQYSVDKNTASRGGVWGFISLQEARKLKIPDEIFHTLPTGAISNVLPLGKRYLVMRFLADSVSTLENERARILDFLRLEKREQYAHQHIENLAATLEWKLEEEGLRLILQKTLGRSALPLHYLTVTEAAQTLFSYQGGAISVEDYLQTLWQDPSRARSGWGVRDSAEIASVAADLVMKPALLVQAARRQGIDARPEQVAWLEKARWSFALEQLRRQEVLDKVVVSDAEVLQVYEEHGEAFRQSQEFYLIEVLVETREEADALRVRLEGGEHLHTLAIGHSIRPGAAEDSGVLHLQGRDRYARPDLYNAAKEAELEEIVGPVQGKEGYSLFKVFAREGGEIAPFAEVEKKARSFAHLGTKQRLFEEFVDALHEKYRDRITVYSDKLEQALPEAFLKQHKALEPAGDK